jgi:hypothetical protein
MGGVPRSSRPRPGWSGDGQEVVMFLKRLTRLIPVSNVPNYVHRSSEIA